MKLPTATAVAVAVLSFGSLPSAVAQAGGAKAVPIANVRLDSGGLLKIHGKTPFLQMSVKNFDGCASA